MASEHWSFSVDHNLHIACFSVDLVIYKYIAFQWNEKFTAPGNPSRISGTVPGSCTSDHHWLVVEPYPSEKWEFVNGKDDIPYMKWKIKVMFQNIKTITSYQHHITSPWDPMGHHGTPWLWPPQKTAFSFISTRTFTTPRALHRSMAYNLDQAASYCQLPNAGTTAMKTTQHTRCWFLNNFGNWLVVYPSHTHPKNMFVISINNPKSASETLQW